jgi:hypothetical protein
MMLRAGIVVAGCLLLAGGATAEEQAHEVRRIAPDRFEPNLRDDAEAKPAVAVAPPTKEHPLGSCDKASRGWLNCLRATADLAAILVGAAENRALASLERRKTASASLQRVSVKALADADAKWTELRELECSQLALLKVGPSAPLYETQLICRINRNMERIDQLATRYGAGAS